MCPDDETLALFAEGRLEASAAEALGQHSEGCADCRKMLGVLSRLRSSRSGGGTGGPPDEEPALSPTLGRYEVRARLGAGAMGVVYEAFDPKLARRVAVKVLRLDPRGGSVEERAHRLEREGRVMARLTHRNVAAVYDSGEWEGHAWVAMELVDGVTLRQWLKAAARTPTEVLPVLIEAGRGLAAAHAAGLVHRDFKPDNVLVETGSSRAVVTDFGLAGEPREGAPAQGAIDSLATPVTRPGALVGTPAYMAPEQLEGGAADPRSDQFAFCVAAVEALAGKRPFEGLSVDSLKASIRTRQLDPAVVAAVPARVRRALLRGLESDPLRRFPSMEELLHELVPPARRNLALASALAVVALAGAGAYGFNRARVCHGADARLAGVWDAAQRARLEQAFLATGLPFAASASSSVARSLDAWAGEWTHAYTDACEATRVRGDQSEELLDLRMSCLGQRLAEVRALTQVLATADSAAVTASPGVVGRLSAIRTCADERSLRAPTGVPAEPALRARVDAVRAGLAEVKALQAAGRHREAQARIDALLPDVEALGFRPLEAEAQVMRADVQTDLDDAPAASLSLRRAVVAAMAGGHLQFEAQAWAHLVVVEGVKRANYEEAHRAAERATALLERLGSPAELQSYLARNYGDVLSAEGHHDDAKQQYAKALALLRTFDESGVQIAAALNALANEERELGDVRGGLAQYEEARALLVAKLGPEHPSVGKVLKNFGNVAWAQGDLATALEWYQKALAIQVKALGEGSLEAASTRNNVAAVYTRQGKLTEARAALVTSLATLEAKLGPEHPQLFGQLNNLAMVERGLGRAPEARALLLRALAVAEKAHGPDHEDVATVLLNLGDLELMQHDFASSVKRYERAATITEKVRGPDHPDLAECLGGMAFPLLQLKEHRRAYEVSTRALAIFAKKPGIPLAEAQIHFAHACAAWEVSPTTRSDAVREAKAAREVMAKGGASPDDLGELDTWLKAHR